MDWTGKKVRQPILAAQIHPMTNEIKFYRDFASLPPVMKIKGFERDGRTIYISKEKIQVDVDPSVSFGTVHPFIIFSPVMANLDYWMFNETTGEVKADIVVINRNDGSIVARKPYTGSLNALQRGNLEYAKDKDGDKILVKVASIVEDIKEDKEKSEFTLNWTYPDRKPVEVPEFVLQVRRFIHKEGNAYYVERFDTATGKMTSEPIKLSDERIRLKVLPEGLPVVTDVPGIELGKDEIAILMEKPVDNRVPIAKATHLFTGAVQYFYDRKELQGLVLKQGKDGTTYILAGGGVDASAKEIGILEYGVNTPNLAKEMTEKDAYGVVIGPDGKPQFITGDSRNILLKDYALNIPRDKINGFIRLLRDMDPTPENLKTVLEKLGVEASEEAVNRFAAELKAVDEATKEYREKKDIYEKLLESLKKVEAVQGTEAFTGAFRSFVEAIPVGLKEDRAFDERLKKLDAARGRGFADWADAFAGIILAFAEQQDKEAAGRYREVILEEIARGEKITRDELKSDINAIEK